MRAEDDMGRPKGRPKKPMGEGKPVRIDRDLYGMAKYIAAREGAEISAYVSGLLRPILERHFGAIARSVGESTDANRTKGRKPK